MTKSQYTRKDYERMQARLNPALEELRTEIRETLDQHEDRSHLWTRLKEGWELTEEWLGSEDKWPTIMTGEGLKECKDRGKFWPRSTKVLYVTGGEFKGLTKREMNAFAYIVIKGGYEGELGHHLESLRDSFEKTPKARVDVQNYTPRNIADLASPVYDGGLAKHSASRLDDMLVALGDPKPLMRKHYRGEPWKKSLPWNWLNLNGNLFDDVDAPTDAHECLRALNDIVDNIQPWEASPSTKETFGKPSDDGDVQACLRFNILGEKGTFSGAHVDILGGTWLLCLEGVKLWWAFTDTSALDRKYSSQLAAFAEQGVGWNPGAGQNGMQLIPLEAGDYLLMMPGNITPHAPFSMTDCLMTGGMFWNRTMLPELFDCISWICSNNSVVSNEAIPRQLVDIFQALKASKAYEEDIELQNALDEAESVLRPLLSCTCGAGVCIKGCPCKEGSGSLFDEEGDVLDGELWYRDPGCTLWCNCACKKVGCLDADDDGDDAELEPISRLRSRRTRVSYASGLAQRGERKG